MDDYKKRFLEGEVLNPGDPGYSTMMMARAEERGMRTLGVLGGLWQSLEERATTKARVAEAERYQALRDLYHSKEHALMALERLLPQNLERTKQRVTWEIETQHAEAFIQREHTFARLEGLKAEIEHNKKVTDLKRKAELKELQERVYGVSEPIGEDELRTELNKAYDEIERIEADRAKKEKKGQFNDAAARRYHDEWDVLSRRIEKLKDKLVEH